MMGSVVAFAYIRAVAEAYNKEKEAKPVPHPSEVTKPAFSMNDLHLIGRAIDMADCDEFSIHENRRLDELYLAMRAYLDKTLGCGWQTREALV